MSKDRPHIIITNTLAQVVGRLAAKHPECSVQVEWRSDEPEPLWFVTFTEGVTDHVYVVDDETGTNAPLTDEELARMDRGELWFGDTAS